MRVVSFFAGCGGLDLGFEQAGFNVIWANELESVVRDTYNLNHPNTELIIRDMEKITPGEIPECDGFIGGPPCQPWSVAGKRRGLGDVRGTLFVTYINIINAKRPKFFLIENVKGILDAKFQDTFNEFISNLCAAGYVVKWQLLDAANYRVPQNRERVFIVGLRSDLSVDYDFPEPTCSAPITLSRAIGDIIETPNEYGISDLTINNQSRANHDVLRTGYSDYYNKGNRRRGWNQPSFTIHATADKIPLHPSSPKMLYLGRENWRFQENRMSEYRRFSVRECARIQTFPDSFLFNYKSIGHAYKMIGNAVPPRLAKELARSILSAFNRQRNIEIAPAPTPPEQEISVIVGYYKDGDQYRLILDNQLYYVRSDGRKGSMFKSDCNNVPQYLLLHHLKHVELFELDAEEPILAAGSFLQTLGFSCSGDTYLCFRLKNRIGRALNMPSLRLGYKPFFTTLSKTAIETAIE